MEQDVRWKQRFENYRKALGQLSMFIEKPELNFLEQQGLIQAFEYTYELAWTVLRDFLKARGNTAPMYGSKDTFRAAIKEGLIADIVWMDMTDDRNKTVHTYHEETAQLIGDHTRNLYYPRFVSLAQTLEAFL